jgi:hypothetical protein
VQSFKIRKKSVNRASWTAGEKEVFDSLYEAHPKEPEKFLERIPTKTLQQIKNRANNLRTLWSKEEKETIEQSIDPKGDIEEQIRLVSERLVYKTEVQVVKFYQEVSTFVHRYPYLRVQNAAVLGKK